MKQKKKNIELHLLQDVKLAAERERGGTYLTVICLSRAESISSICLPFKSINIYASQFSMPFLIRITLDFEYSHELGQYLPLRQQSSPSSRNPCPHATSITGNLLAVAAHFFLPKSAISP